MLASALLWRGETRNACQRFRVLEAKHAAKQPSSQASSKHHDTVDVDLSMRRAPHDRTDNTMPMARLPVAADWANRAGLHWHWLRIPRSTPFRSHRACRSPPVLFRCWSHPAVHADQPSLVFVSSSFFCVGQGPKTRKNRKENIRTRKSTCADSNGCRGRTGTTQDTHTQGLCSSHPGELGFIM